jgi:AraC-like DNA-binding protein
MTVVEGSDFAAVPVLGFEEWRSVVRSIAGRYNPEVIDPNDFAGRVQVRSLFGLRADQFDHNVHRIDRTQRDIRLDGVELYFVVFQVAGSSTVLQNDEAVTLDAGDVVLIDSTKPVTYLNEAYARWLSVQLPRQSLLSHLGQEPRGGSRGRSGDRAGRQPISQIAYASGFSDYSYFSRRFRRRFGLAPSVHVEDSGL